MTNARKRRGVLRPSRVALRVATITVLLAWLGTTHPTPTFAQVALDCSTNGYCVSGTIDRLLGLPNGTLRFAEPVRPWDLVVKGPAMVSWAAIEADARAALAALHGVPNDNRLPYAAIDELRGAMFLRLLTLSQRKAVNYALILENQPYEPLSPAETEAVEMLYQLVKNRRVTVATKALLEYQRWQSDPCHFRVPAGFGFEQYDPGPGCGLPQQVLFGPPSPPTADQFLQYGAALTGKQEADALVQAKRRALGIPVSQTTFVYDADADKSAAFKDAAEGYLIMAAVSLSVAIGGAAVIAAAASAGVAGAFAALSGSFSAWGAAAAAGGATLTGIGAAASLPLIVILCIVLSVIRGIQVTEDYAVPTKLQEALTAAYATPDPWSIAATEAGQVELFSIFIHQTLPSYDEQRQATLAPPQQRQLGDPQFEVAAGGTSVQQDTIETLGLNGRQQQTFMSQGWFVTRDKQSDGTWGPPRWTLNLRYLEASGDQAERTLGIQPSTFLLSSLKPGTFQPEPIRRVGDFIAATPSGSRRIAWAGNHAPVIKATASHQARIAEPVQFNAAVTDLDGDSITRVRWYFETGNRSPIYQTSLAECSFRPAGRVDAAGLPYLCPLTPVDGTSASITYTSPGTYSVMVMAEDSEGGISSETFSITVDKFVPELTITQLGFTTLPGPGSTPSIAEGQPVTVKGTLNFPVNPSGNYSDLTKLVIDWGDGQISERMYPCRVGTDQAPSDFTCLYNTTTREFVEEAAGGGPNPGSPNLPRGPWTFDLSHTYAYRPDRPLQPMGTGVPLTPNDGTARVKVYAVTALGAWTDTHRLDFTIRNTTPAVEMRGICPVVPTGGGSCSGDRREAGASQPLTLSGRIFDLLAANHLVTVLWGDGTSSELPPGCTEAGCPAFSGWPEVIPVPGQFPKYFYLNHTYPDIGTYALTVIVNDGGPNGKVTLSAGAASIFGLSKLTGAVETSAGVETVYSFTTKLPAGATLSTPTPTCEGGSASNLTASGFTCTFNDVATTTKRKVAVQAVIAGTTFTRSLDVDVRPTPVKIANFDGPTNVIGGMTRTYTYTGTHSQFATVLFSPYCGLGEVTSHVPGSSFSCLFADTGPIDFAVGVSASDSLGNTAEASLTVNLEPDTLAPVLTVPTEIRLNSTSNDGAIAAFIITALDNVSGSVRVNCDAQSGVLYPIGTTTVLCKAVDWKGLVGSATFPIRVIDVTPPTLTLPASQQLNATSPLGAVATFVATAVDVTPLTPTCTPASGSTFAAGATTVSCSATDAAGNTRSGTFTITVVGAAQQIADLQRWIERQSMNATVQKQIVASLKKAGQAAASGDSSAACKQLANVISTVTSNQAKLTNALVNKILNDVARIQTVVGC